MSYLGIEIDNEKNANFERGVPVNLTKEGARVATWVIPTDEEYMIAIDTKRLSGK
jgi:acetate kinase